MLMTGINDNDDDDDNEDEGSDSSRKANATINLLIIDIVPISAVFLDIIVIVLPLISAYLLC